MPAIIPGDAVEVAAEPNNGSHYARAGPAAGEPHHGQVGSLRFTIAAAASHAQPRGHVAELARRPGELAPAIAGPTEPTASIRPGETAARHGLLAGSLAIARQPIGQQY